MVFADLPPREVVRVLSIGSWKTTGQGERLIECGKPVDSISLIVRGRVQVTHAGQVLGEMGPGEIVGSALLMTGATSEADAVTVEPSRTLLWNVGTLERYLDAHPDTRNVFQRHVTRDLAGKVKRMAKGVSSASSASSSST